MDVPDQMTTEEIMKFHNKVKGADFEAWLEIVWVRKNGGTK